ncbi:restriction endonuclease subunit S [Photobacterium damselae]|uniref:restriction endonuclease subunit S n=1 Tax=Photobacterium damselae TaxID=38293 RepID=UPI002543A1A9
MTVESLITQHIDTWTSAVKTKSTTGRGSSKKLELYGVKKLRELILELAVRGKLVPQDPSDESVSVLLERIAEKKAQLVKEKKIKKPKKLAEVYDNEFSFELPSTWDIKRLPEVYYTISPSGKKLKSSDVLEEGSYPVIDQGQGDIAGYSNDEERLINIESPIIIFGDHTRNIKYIDFSFVPGADGTKILCPVGIVAEFFYLQLKSYDLESRGYGRHFKILNENLFVIPPLEEQHRIVAKVDELMALCDQLEQQTEASIEAHQLLVSTLLNTLTNSADADELMENWARISDHFDTLFTTEESIDQLKQTILQLAVMGKLVPQDPSDEPASVQLERIAEEKAQLIKEKKIKKQKALPPIANDEKPFDLPNGWEWCRFEDVVEIYSGITKGRKLSGRELKTIPYLSVANVQRGYLNLQNVKEIDLPIDEIEKYSVLEGDLLITEGGDWDKVGRTAIWRSEVPYMAHQNHVFKARPYLSEQSEVWIEMYLNGPFARDYFAGSSKQTTNLASINKTQLRSCFIAVPPNGEKQRITSKVKDLIEMCNLLLERIARCQQTQYHLTDAIVEQAI